MKSHKGESPLLYAILQENIELVKLLLDRGADVNIQNDDGESPIFGAIELKNIPIIKLLLAK